MINYRPKVVGSPAKNKEGMTMTLRKILAMSCLLLPIMACAHNLEDNQRVPPVGIADRGELTLNKDDFSYKNWNSAQLAGKVRVLLHIAGRTSAKEKNAALIEAIKSAGLPHDRYQTTTIVNTDDAIPGSGMFVRSSIESNKKLYPWSQFIVDSNGVARNAWQLKEEGSAVIVLDKDGRVQWVKDGALTQQEVQQVVDLLHKLLSK
ncbi:Protein YtfJ [Salmonella enterica subsp. enterica serovar Adelaide str. A4-669]|uniref:Protein YtfJ n=7 Tax=Gammaproteobacteria TaxID=1236 RepID=A0A6C8GDD4_SALET|nr:Protein YtfJ [Salmonella enterica subsp. enterica serovar Adelaide str. A4-669]